jgi:hypothetical protein
MKFIHISPTAHLNDFCNKQKDHLILAHLVESDPKYRQWYQTKRQSDPGVNFILDNSAFEMYKQGKPMYPASKLIEMGKEVGANYIVMPDYPGSHGEKTERAALEYGPEFKDAGFGTFFCPQSRVGDSENDIQEYQLLESFRWAASQKFIDYVGFSCLAIPNAYGVEKGNNLQRFMARHKFIKKLERMGILDYMKLMGKKLHLLGMVDGPNEISLLGPWLHKFTSWDSSAAVWAGLNNIEFDNSPTGLVDGKLELHVDFDAKIEDTKYIQIARENIMQIKRLILNNEQRVR